MRTGWHMRVAQGGINFSGGQRQRLAIARAVIRVPPIYLFDDAFSALDVRTDARVRAALREVSGDVYGCHCLPAYFDGRGGRSDRRRRGRPVVGTGTHESLLDECPEYARVRRLRGGRRK